MGLPRLLKQLLILLCVPTLCFGAVSYVTSGSAVTTAISGTTVTFTSIVNLPDTTGITIVGIATGNSDGSDDYPTAVTLGGTTVTKMLGGATANTDGCQYNNSGFGNIWFGYVLNSSIGSTGNKNLVVTLHVDPATASDEAAGVVCLSGQDGTTPIGTPLATSFGSGDITQAITDSATGDMVVDMGGTATGGVNSSTQTERWVQNSGWGNGAQSTAAGASGTVTMGYNMSDDSSIAAVTVKAAAASGTKTYLGFF